jgi:hypothetical protein
MSDTETNADLLRRAAALMRKRAKSATPGPWEVMHAAEDHIGFREPSGFFSMLKQGTWGTKADTEHVASWHPAVALAVADLMDDGATFIEYVAANHSADASGTEGQFFLAVARAYLGEQ